MNAMLFQVKVDRPVQEIHIMHERRNKLNVIEYLSHNIFLLTHILWSERR